MKRLSAVLALVLGLPTGVYAISPEFVGTYVGNYKAKVTDATGQSSVKQSISISIAADETTTVSLDGIVQDVGEIATNGLNAVLVFGKEVQPDVDMVILGSMRFNKTKLSGVGTGATLNTSGTGTLISYIEAKYTLKKQ